MAYPDFEFTEPNHSYIWSSEMLRYIQSYAAKFNVEPSIKFRHEVVRIRPLGMRSLTKWEVGVRINLSNNFRLILIVIYLDYSKRLSQQYGHNGYIRRCFRL